MCGNCDYHLARAEQQRSLAAKADETVRPIHERLATLHDERLERYREEHDRAR